MAICNRCLSTLPTPDSPCPSCQSSGFIAPSSVPDGNAVRQTIVQPLTNASSPTRRSPAGSVELPELSEATPPIRRTMTEPGAIPVASAATVGSQVAVSASPEPQSAQVYRPYRRPPTPVLVVIDEGCQVDGEILRIRGESFVIGRSDGDFRVPNDPDISGKHLELTVQERSGERVWTLRDLGSTNGTFVRVNQAALVAGKELLLGYGRYRIELDSADASSSATASSQSQDIRSTRVYAPSMMPMGVAESLRLVDVADANRVLRFPTQGGIVGSDSSLGELHVDDPALNGQHARIAKTTNRWRIEDLATTNGCWLRINQLRITQDMEFQIGEQRFRFLPNGYRGLAIGNSPARRPRSSGSGSGGNRSVASQTQST